MYIITNKVFLRKLRWCFCFIIIYSIITLKKNDIKIEKREQILTSFSYDKSSRKYTHILCLRKTALLILFLKKYIVCSLLVLIKLHQQSYSLLRQVKASLYRRGVKSKTIHRYVQGTLIPWIFGITAIGGKFHRMTRQQTFLRLSHHIQSNTSNQTLN